MVRRVCASSTLFVLVGALAFGCHDDPPEPKGPKPSKPLQAEGETMPPVVAPEPAEPGVQEDGSIVSAVEWFEGSLEGALAAAKADGKLVFVDVGAYWCPPCHELHEKTFIDVEVGEYFERGYVALHIDAEKGEGPEIVERYRVQAYPTLLVLEPSGVEKGRLVDFLEPKALLEALASIEKGENTLADLEDAVESKPDDLEARYRLGYAYALVAKKAEAEAQFEPVLVGDPKNSLGLASKVLYARTMFVTYKIDGDKERAVEQYRDLQRRFPDSPEATRAYRQLGRVLCELGRKDEAGKSLQKMIASDPDDSGLKASFGWFSFREKCQPEAGLVAVEAGIQQDPKNADLYYLRAELRHLLGDNDAALVSIGKAVELEPKSAYYRRQVRRFQDIAGAR